MKRRALLLGAMFPRDGRKIVASLQLRKGCDLVIGVDRGFKYSLALGLRPDLAIGDWDSLRDLKLLGKCPRLTLPREKDRSDLYFAACAAVNAGATEIVAIGVTGGRPDHELAAFLDLAELAANPRFGLKNVAIEAAEYRHSFIAPGSPWKAKLRSGQLVSIFALNGTAHGVTLRGLKYALRGERLIPSSHGLSNQSVGGACSVSLKQGLLLVMLKKQDEASSRDVFPTLTKAGAT